MAQESAHPPQARPNVPVRRIRKAFEQVADQLREIITAGALLPGERLPTEAELASQFGVSRATVREALRLLSAQNLVRTAKGVGGGSYVNAPTAAHVSDLLGSNLGLMSGELGVDALIEARAVLEVPAARLAAGRRTADDLQALHAAIPDALPRLPIEERFIHNRDFHFRVLQAAGNPLLSIVAKPIFLVLHARTGGTASRGAQRSVDDDHREIARALEAGDGDAAEDAMRRHLERLRPGYERSWNADNSRPGRR
ncbi:MAG: hypothetical protein V7607_4997 [Solirubrobacteraceae bacterium]